LSPVFVTRSYVTRHGAGPLPFEMPHSDLPGVTDTTNILNFYQGHLRFGYLIPDYIEEICNEYVSAVRRGFSPSISVAVTCLDQTDGRIVSSEDVVRRLDPLIHYRSYGPTRENIKEQL
jgi:adenylosuccinate synthase